MKTYSFAFISLAAVASASVACSNQPASDSESATTAADTSGAVRLGDVLRDTHDQVRKLDHKNAVASCEIFGTRLPTARELGEFAVSRGAHGFRETAFPGVSFSDTRVQGEDATNVLEAFFATGKPNADGNLSVDFYFNSNGYEQEVVPFDYWTSSAYPDSPDAHGFFMMFDGATGSVNEGTVDGTFLPVRCIAK